MAIYFNSQQRKKISWNGKNVKQVWCNGKKYFQYESYNPDQVIISKTAGAYTFNQILPKGVYRIALCGAGGSGQTWVYGSYGWGSNGGSGAFVEIEFENPKDQNVVIYAPPGISGRGQSGQDAYVDLGGTRVITAGGGRAGGVNSGGGAGTYSITGINVTKTIKASNGNAGGTGFSGSAGGGQSVSNYDNWGYGRESNSGPGGVILTYLRYEP